jgi:hypothetical protein
MLTEECFEKDLTSQMEFTKELGRADNILGERQALLSLTLE